MALQNGTMKAPFIPSIKDSADVTNFAAAIAATADTEWEPFEMYTDTGDFDWSEFS